MSPPRCPFCESDDVDRIIYGMQMAPSSREANEKVRYAGCIVILGESPDFHCNECGNEWRAGEPREGRRRFAKQGPRDA